MLVNVGKEGKLLTIINKFSALETQWVSNDMNKRKCKIFHSNPTNGYRKLYLHGGYILDSNIVHTNNLLRNTGTFQ